MAVRNRSPWQIAGTLSALALTACAPSGQSTLDESGDPPVAETAEALVSSGHFFPDPLVRFCFDTPGFTDFKARFSSGVMRTFQNFTNVALQSAGECASIDTSGNLIRVALEVGVKGSRSYTDIAAHTMHIFDNSSEITWAHEFTHALGFLHTQDANGSLCTLQAVTTADGAIGPYDSKSLMNYCGDKGPKGFSDLDLMGIDVVYGAPGVISADTFGAMFRHRLYRKKDGSQQDYRCSLQAGQVAAFTGLHGAPVGSPDSTFSTVPVAESSFSYAAPTDVGACAYPPGFYQIDGQFFMVVGDRVEVDPAANMDTLRVNEGSVCRIVDDAQKQFFHADMRLHTAPSGTNLWVGRAAKTMVETPPCLWGDGFYRIEGADPIYRLSGADVDPAICHVQNPAQLAQYQQVGRAVTAPQPPLLAEVNVAVPPHVLPAGTPLSSLATKRPTPVVAVIPECAWPDGLYSSNGAVYSVSGATYCHVVDPAQLASFHGPTPSDVTGQEFFQGATGQTFSGSGSNGQSGAQCLASYTFPVTAGSTYTVSTVPGFTGDTFVVVSGACACSNDDYGGGWGSQCSCTATSTGTATICASTYGSSAASWNYKVTGGGGYTSLGDCPWPKGNYRNENGTFRVLDATSVCRIQNDEQLQAFGVGALGVNDVTNDSSFFHFWQQRDIGLCAWPSGVYRQGAQTYAIGANAALPHAGSMLSYGGATDPIGDICSIVRPSQAALIGSVRDANDNAIWPLFNMPPVVVPSDSMLAIGRSIPNAQKRVPECPWLPANYKETPGPASDPTTFVLNPTGASLYDGTITYNCQRDASTPSYADRLLSEPVNNAIWQCPLAASEMPPLTVTCSDYPCTTTSWLTVHYQGMTGSVDDWIAPVPLGESSDHYVGKHYLPAGQPTGQLVFRAPGAGLWTLRAFIRGSYVLRAESALVLVQEPNPGLIQLTCADTPCTDASALVASYTNAPTAQDALHDGYTVQLAIPDTSTQLAYQYSLPTSATLTFQGGDLLFPASSPGHLSFPLTGSVDVVARIYLRATGAVLSESAPVRLWPNLNVTCSTPDCHAGDTITVSYHKLPAAGSWIEIVPASTPRTGIAFLPHSLAPYFSDTNGQVAGSVSFTVKSGDVGSFIARAYKQAPSTGLFPWEWPQSGLDSAPFLLSN